MSKHTSGEWWFSKMGLEVLSMPDQVKISKVNGSNIKEAKANGRLIANAPKLLEACEKALESLVIRQDNEVVLETIKLVENAIKRAKGE